jgi:hypothetical protein
MYKIVETRNVTREQMELFYRNLFCKIPTKDDFVDKERYPFAIVCDTLNECVKVFKTFQDVSEYYFDIT